jgi:hypothetical protein
MGNRAIVKAKNNDNKGVYLHWNGGRDSVEAFLKYCELKGFRNFEDDYGMARFCQVVGNYFGGCLSIGIIDDPLNWEVDNGIYEVEGWKIAGRKDFEGREQQKYELTEMLIDIDEAQPTNQQLGKDFFTADEVPTETIKVNDKVYMQEFDGTYKKYEVVGIGEDKVVNGSNRLGVPFVNRFCRDDGDYSWNPNNYITEKIIKKAI